MNDEMLRWSLHSWCSTVLVSDDARGCSVISFASTS
jgi:hypothetical protein